MSVSPEGAPEQVSLGAAGPDRGTGGAADLPARDAQVSDVLDWARRAATAVPQPGEGSTVERWEWLATLGAWDLTQARTLEPHLDALAILREHDPGRDPWPGATWGVWAAEGPAQRLDATAPERPGGSWSLSGTKPWCSLAGEVSHALVTAWVPGAGGAESGLFALEVDQPGCAVEEGGWSDPLGLRAVRTATVHLDGALAVPVGAPGWYLSRPGFAWGGIGVAAVWYGAAVALLRRMLEQAHRREPDQVALMHLGEAGARLAAARAVLAYSATRIDASAATGAAGALLAAEVRQVVADAVEDTLRRCGHSLGPGPLAHEPEHAGRVGDLTLYLRQHHAERDAAALGRAMLDRGTAS